MSSPPSTNVGKIMPVPVTRASGQKKSPRSSQKKSARGLPEKAHKRWFRALNVRGCVVKWWAQPRSAGGVVVLKRVCGLSCASHGRRRYATAGERGVVNARHERRHRVTLRQRGKDVECSSGEIRTIEFLSECRCLIWFKNSRLGLLYEKVQGEPDPI